MGQTVSSTDDRTGLLTSLEIFDQDRLSNELIHLLHHIQNYGVLHDESGKVIHDEEVKAEDFDSFTINQPSVWFLGWSDLRRWPAYPIKPARKTIYAAAKIVERLGVKSLSGNDLMTLNLLLDDTINTTFWSKGTRSYTDSNGQNLGVGYWFGFGNTPPSPFNPHTYAREEGYFCGRNVKPEPLDDYPLSSVPVAQQPIRNSGVVTPADSSERRPKKGSYRIRKRRGGVECRRSLRLLNLGESQTRKN
ncbi:hypothetical protein ACJZ2D_016253 [Fusarium nematophilum]